MALPLYETFHYTMVVPSLSKQPMVWPLQDASGANPSQFWKRNSHTSHRLLGLDPTLEVGRDQLVLRASSRRHAQVASVSIDIAPHFIEVLHVGYEIHLVREMTSDLGISVLRNGKLIMAIGAVSSAPLGEPLSLLSREPESCQTKASSDHNGWIECTVFDETIRLKENESSSIADFDISVLRCASEGLPGSCECVAISHKTLCSHRVAVDSAKRLMNPNDLTIVDWPWWRFW